MHFIKMNAIEHLFLLQAVPIVQEVIKYSFSAVLASFGGNGLLCGAIKHHYTKEL